MAEREAADAARAEATAQAEREAADTARAEAEAAVIERAAAAEAPSDASPQPETDPSPAPARSTTDPAPIYDRPAELLAGETPFEPWAAGWRGGRIVLDKLDVTANKRLVTAALVEGINAEGPVHLDRLARLVAGAFEVRKLSPSRVTDIGGVIPRSTVSTENGTVFWPARTGPVDYQGFRSSDTEVRPTEHLALRELGNAMVGVLLHRGPLTRDELFGITRRVFGGKRVTPAIETRMIAALDEAIAQGRIRRTGDRLDLVTGSYPQA